ncbi:putative ribosomal protein L6, chloroplast [Arabidopsis thaliana]|uniref:PSRP6 n=3 Tax=Arabidopsis TaxID=3701 RepID=A0A178UJG0_ARATH|nr:Ribosomal protein L6 chloroplast [Arabidopsis thaliana x Arabidopsis arenosa]KAG7609571.1 Ribosomal protein L6 chloroplast [Arabidopsis suecica]OAO93397.1 PSRP6 [Arabidopsis thaliana]
MKFFSNPKLEAQTHFHLHKDKETMSVSAIFGTGIVTVAASPVLRQFQVPKLGNGGGLGMVIECSSRPQKKSTAHHRKTRPKKTQPWDIKRKPTVYAPLPPLPAEWSPFTLASDDGGAAVAASPAGDLVSGSA